MKFDKTILNKVMILPLGLVILFIVYRTLVFSVIMNCIPIMQEHYIIAVTIINCIDIMTIVVLMFIFKLILERCRDLWLAGADVYSF